MKIFKFYNFCKNLCITWVRFRYKYMLLTIKKEMPIRIALVMEREIKLQDSFY